MMPLMSFSLFSLFSFSLFSLFSFSFLLSLARADTVTYDFNISWVSANPDGGTRRPTIGINGQWPLPLIQATLGDTVEVNVLNQLGNQSTSLHFHGLFMRDTPHMDGTSAISQCAIAPGESFQYKFKVDQPGTYWYHSHTQAQYPDGLRGPLIVHDPNAPFAGEYERDVVITVSDWYHRQMAELLPAYMSQSHMLMDPVPDAVLLNDTHDLRVPVGGSGGNGRKTYLFRLINVGALLGQYLAIQGHEMTVVEVDGVYTRPTRANVLFLAAGQRCSVLVEMKDMPDRNYPIVTEIDTSMIMGSVRISATGWLDYGAQHDEQPRGLNIADALDDLALVPLDEQPLLEADRRIVLNMNVQTIDGAKHWLFNDSPFIPPTEPVLYTALSAGDKAVQPTSYEATSNVFVLAANEVVEIVVNNNHMGRHPFHLHGHHFQLLHRSDDWAGAYHDEMKAVSSPIRRDTAIVNPGGNLVIRFKADNPGVWLFHCHMEWHAHSGLMATMVEDPLSLSLGELSCKDEVNEVDEDEEVDEEDKQKENNSLPVLISGIFFLLVLTTVVGWSAIPKHRYTYITDDEAGH
ncbi:hypothetical protein ASPZODRAFT_136734 [Penicilliopsis zonata CBS 506.65]|uniref:Multicopper oxidase n=1 Tax=Penicilliopsis zonata CBS 506.65 TaxID=1073090 RepID=A0A1L9S7R0_9EURO|nr:hypothetical protein ASPZODRAFT_136734 [Penicilliopsis zonata CBS 506.65]OJJ43174.1 hypothetical protein ASPZODRAFT_136734 [Penicilliopsis zonata CBS 506.65]